MLSALTKQSLSRYTSLILRKPLISHEAIQTRVVPQIFIRHHNLQPFNQQEKFAKQRTKLLIKDKVPHTYDLIYSAPLDIYMSMMAATVTGLTVLAAGAAIYKGVITTEDFNVPMSTSHDIILASSGYEVMGFFGLTACIFVVTKILIRRYVLRIYKYDEKYIAVFRGHLPGLTSKVYFEAGEVEATKVGKIIGWKDGLYKLGNRKAFLLVDYFRTSHDLKVMVTDPDDLKEEEDDS